MVMSGVMATMATMPKDVYKRQVLVAGPTGVVLGIFGGLFGRSITEVTAFRNGHPWMLYLLPAAGLLIVAIYKLDPYKTGTNKVLEGVQSDTYVPLRMAPLIVIATVLTHACGGSAGREGAALQLGGSIGGTLGTVSYTHLLTDRLIKRRNFLSIKFCQFFNNFTEGCMIHIHLGYEKHTGQLIFFAELPCLLGSDFHSCFTGYYDNGCVCSCNCFFHFSYEIKVSRSCLLYTSRSASFFHLKSGTRDFAGQSLNPRTQ